MTQDRAIYWTRVGVGAFWTAVVLLILSGAAGESPVEPSPSRRMIQLTIVPEGWAFFTRDPQEPADVVYRDVPDGFSQLTFANTSARNLFGVSRAARAFQNELAGLLAPILKSSWSACEGDPRACVSSPASRPLFLINRSATRYICGGVVVVRSPPVRWAWSRSRDRVHMPSRVLSLKVDCGP